MNLSQFTIESKLDARKGRLHAAIRDDLTSTTVPDLRRELMEAISLHGMDKWRYLYLDIRSCKMIDSTGMNWLFAEHTRLKGNHKELVLRLSSPAINRVIRFTGLDKLTTVKYRRRKQTR